MEYEPCSLTLWFKSGPGVRLPGSLTLWFKMNRASDFLVHFLVQKRVDHSHFFMAAFHPFLLMY